MAGRSITRGTLGALAFVGLLAGCTAIAGLDADYRARSTGSGGAGGATSASSSSSVTTGTTGGGGSGGAAPTCTDQTANGNETDVDCGGDACPACPADKACVHATDCLSGYCNANRCDRLLAVAAGVKHTCAITSAKTVKCWGANDRDELGQNAQTDKSATPIDVPLPDVVDTLAAGATHTCAKPPTGKIFCWGDNRSDELGTKSGNQHANAITTMSAGQLFPTSAGAAFTCVGNGGASGASCWGGDGVGQLGDGMTDASPTPVAVLGISGVVTHLGAGNAHACAIVGGAPICWGENDSKQLGDGSATGLVEIVGGADHTCARTAAGAVSCWGSNNFEQLGNDTVTGSTAAPNAVAGVVATQLAAGSDHTCALQGTEVLCWGDNATAELGVDPRDVGKSAAPVTVPQLPEATQISAGGKHTCALTRDGGVYCWGSNGSDELGIDGGSFQFPPVQVRFQ